MSQYSFRFGHLLLCFLSPFLVSFPTSSAQFFQGHHTVRVEQGFVRGRLWNVTNRVVQVFLGIPFAERPVGANRFQKPVKKRPWDGDHIAFEYGPPCIQFMDFHEHDKFSGKNMKRQREDCLYLNIFSPYPNDRQVLFPVIVWIHGGSFLAGSSDSGIDNEVVIENLISRNVTLVTLNYRLGPLGFLSTSKSNAKGNFGIWDQIEALKWIRSNIREFSGNPDSVTVMGESAGGSSASLLALSPVTEGLIHRAILMSGSAAAGWAVQQYGMTNWNVENLYKYLTCEKRIVTEESWNYVETKHDYDCNFLQQAIQCDVSSDDLYECIKQKADFSNPLMRKAFTYELGLGQVVIDGEIIPYDVKDLFVNHSRVPILTGVASMEWAHKKALFYGFKSYTEVDHNLALEKALSIVHNSFLPYYEGGSLTNNTAKILAMVALHHYVKLNNSQPSLEMSKFVNSLQRMESDVEFVAPMLKEVESYLNNNNTVYVYSFEHLPSEDIIEEDWVNVNLFGLKRRVRTERKLPISNAFHGLDHAFIFTKGYSSNTFFSYSDSDRKIADALCEFITNFAKTGNPTPKAVHGVVWPPADLKYNNYLTVDWPLRVEENGAGRWTDGVFWKNVMPSLADAIKDGDKEKYRSLSADEQLQLAAFRRAWWALWVLVVIIALVLWIIIICLVTQKCLDVRSKHYKNIIVADV